MTSLFRHTFELKERWNCQSTGIPLSAAIWMTLTVTHIVRENHGPELIVVLVVKRSISLMTSEGTLLNEHLLTHRAEFTWFEFFFSG